MSTTEPREPTWLRVDDFAREGGVATTTIRLYQAKGLLPPPRLVGRTGYYDNAHATRLRTILRLADEGFSLAGIGRLLQSWDDGEALADVVGASAGLSTLLGGPAPVRLDIADVAARFPPDSLTPDLIERAARLSMLRLLDDGTVEVADRRFLEAGAALAHLGVPLGSILDEWEALAPLTEKIAAQFVEVFEQHLVPADWDRDPSEAQITEMALLLGQLSTHADAVVSASVAHALSALGDEKIKNMSRPDEVVDA